MRLAMVFLLHHLQQFAPTDDRRYATIGPQQVGGAWFGTKVRDRQNDAIIANTTAFGHREPRTDSERPR